MEYEVGIRLDRIEAKLDALLVQTRGMTLDEAKQFAKEVDRTSEKLEGASAPSVPQSRPKKGGKSDG